MRVIKKINNRNYTVTISPVPAIKQKKILALSQKKVNTYNLDDVTFLIPVRIESEDRKRCLIIVIDYLLKYFNTKIIVCEESSNPVFPTLMRIEWKPHVRHIFRQTNSDLFHKTKNINIMANESTTPIICIHDSDVLFKPSQYINTANIIKGNIFDLCYPFNEPNHNIPKELRDTIQLTLDLASIEDRVSYRHPLPPPGGCLFFNKEKFIEGGKMNENFLSWGAEDQEVVTRFLTLGYKLGSGPGKLFHIDHDRTLNSTDQNRQFLANQAEFEKVKAMNKEELRAYVNTWGWIK